MPTTPLRWTPTDLPVEAFLDRIVAPLTSTTDDTRSVVVTAEPGAGKSSLIPLAAANAMDGNGPASGSVIVLEPRRLAARATANRLAELVGSTVGGTVGLTIRGERKVSRATRIEVVTEAVLTNRLQSDPDLPGVAALVFDEFHERNLHSDLALAMALESRSALRPDLAIIVMSATIDPGPVATLLGGDRAADVVAVPGRTFPVSTTHLERPHRNRWAEAVVGAVNRALTAVDGDVLVFAPGRGEINRVERQLGKLLDSSGRRVDVIGLHGGSPPDVQRSVLVPAARRRVIVATAVAETSITIPTIEAVVDGGLLRRAVFDPASGLGRLETVHATRFAADQRRGRAGRVGPGICLRLWSEADHELLDDAVPPEIVDGNVLPVAFELARWGDPHGRSLPLLDHPGESRLQRAHQQLAAMGLTTIDGVLTDEGRAAASMPIDPRFAALVLSAARAGGLDIAIEAAAVLSEDNRAQSTDLEQIISRRRHEPSVRRTAKRLRRSIDQHSTTTVPLDSALATAWPDRVAIARPGRPGHFLLAVGREVQVDDRDPLAGAPFLIVAEADGQARAARIRSAVMTDRATVLDACREHITWVNEAMWDERSNKILAERRQTLGQIILHREPDPSPDPAAIQRALRRGVRSRGLDVFNWSDRATTIRHRLAWLHEQDSATWPPVDDSALLDGALVDDGSSWLRLERVNKPSQLRSLDIGTMLLDRLGWEQRASFDELAPVDLPLPTGGRQRVVYESGRPVWSVRLQRLFGLDRHPTIGPNSTPVTIELLSPANRPTQTTTDLPGFWRGSYRDVRADLRGRYPKHAWPEDPLSG